MLKELYNKYPLTLGTDPELFIGRMSGKRFAAKESRLVVPPDGLTEYNPSYNQAVVRDGMQIELHVGGAVFSCRQALASSVSRHIGLLHDAVQRHNASRKKNSLPLHISFRQLVKLTAADKATMDADSLQLNCRETLNAYGREPIKRDGAEYPYRSASGHIHMGTKIVQAIDPVQVVKVLDVIVGIPCVLVSRSKDEAIRRETYGRAGEYRLPKHGLEYRTPSNFWLTNYKLFSMVTGLVKLGHMIAGTANLRPVEGRWAYDQLLESVEKIGGFEKVEQAINTNDRNLALRIYKTAIRPVVQQLYSYVGFGANLMDPFEYFVETVEEKGLSNWIPTTDAAVLRGWLPGTFDRGIGWERFLSEEVAPRMRMAKFTGIVLDPEKDVAVEKPSRRRSGAIQQAEATLRVAA